MGKLSFEERVEIARHQTFSPKSPKNWEDKKVNCYSCAFFIRGLEDSESHINPEKGYNKIKKECVNLPRIPEKGCFLIMDYEGMGIHIGLVVNDYGLVFERKETMGVFMDNRYIDDVCLAYPYAKPTYWMHPSELDF